MMRNGKDLLEYEDQSFMEENYDEKTYDEVFTEDDFDLSPQKLEEDREFFKSEKIPISEDSNDFDYSINHDQFEKITQSLTEKIQSEFQKNQNPKAFCLTLKIFSEDAESGC